MTMFTEIGHAKQQCLVRLQLRVVQVSLLCAAVCLCLMLVASTTVAQSKPVQASQLPDATASHLPRWRGFNLLEKFNLQWSNEPFHEDDFRIIHELGFNFVRLPLDYRIWIRDGDWSQINEDELRQIDEAVRWGQQYSIHVCINFHRAPGYTVAAPPEKLSVWRDPEAQRVCALHWTAFAKRYRGIPNRNLSFNLFNEPTEDAGDDFVPTIKKMVDAIRAEDPDRLIISDGMSWGTRPVLELKDLSVAQATRGYAPFGLTHYKANWVQGFEQMAKPSWPDTYGQALLLSQTKAGVDAEHKRPLIISGNFDQATQLRLKVATVSTAAKLVVTADGEPIYEKAFACGPGIGEWKAAVFNETYKVYQNVYDRDYTLTIPAGTKRVELLVVDGDWLSLSELGLTAPGGPEHVLAMHADWGESPSQLSFDVTRKGQTFGGATVEGRQWLYDTTVAPWVAARERGIGVMVGEFGAFMHTSHDVTLAWMEDALANWKQADMGWALWNLRGGFGILDSGREDVEYEEFQDHKLDRKMLELLQRY